jgi:hypothetical protein
MVLLFGLTIWLKYTGFLIESQIFSGDAIPAKADEPARRRIDCHGYLTDDD